MTAQGSSFSGRCFPVATALRGTERKLAACTYSEGLNRKIPETLGPLSESAG